MVDFHILLTRLTFVEALFAVQDGKLVSPEAGGPVELTMVLVELPVRAAHSFIVQFTVIQTFAVSLARLTVDHTVTSQAAVLVLARIGVDIVSHQT